MRKAQEAAALMESNPEAKVDLSALNAAEDVDVDDI